MDEVAFTDEEYYSPVESVIGEIGTDFSDTLPDYGYSDGSKEYESVAREAMEKVQKAVEDAEAGKQ